MKKIILIATLLFSGAIFAFADMNCYVTFNNCTNESITIAQAGSGWAYTNMPNTITVAPYSAPSCYNIDIESNPDDNIAGVYDGVQGFDIYNSNQSQDTHLEIAVNDDNLFTPILNMGRFLFGNYVTNNPQSFQGIWLSYWYGINQYMMGSAYNSNSHIPFCITTIMESNSSIMVNIYNPTDINSSSSACYYTTFYADNYYNNTPTGFMGDSNNSGILVLDGLYDTGTIYVDQNGSFIPWGGWGQWRGAEITNIPSYLFNSDGTLNSMTVDLEDGHVWKYANGQWSQQI